MSKITEIFQLQDVDHHDMIVYIMKIHPRHWTVFGNRNDILDSNWENEYEEYLLSMKVKTRQLTETKKLIL